ncbi:hypothetical protein BDV11DRAFT_169947 [Aspergillus similis]
MSVGVPDTFSPACHKLLIQYHNITALNQTTQCNSTLSFIAPDGLFPSSDVLATICMDSCKESLQSFRSQEIEACGDEYYDIVGQFVPASYGVDQLLFAYNYTCLQDGTTDEYCAPLIDEWSQAGPTDEQSCTKCMLKTFQVELNSPFGYYVEFASYYSSLTSGCGLSDYPITSPPPYTVTATTSPSTTTTTTATPSISCASKYTVKEGDDCISVSLVQKVSEAMLRYNNEIAADCSNSLKRAAHSVFLTLVIAPGEAGGLSVTTTTTSIIATPTAAPTNVANGTNTRCAKYYEVVPGDTCSPVTVMMAISLGDFYFLNPEVNSTSCNSLLAGSSYCVQAVGDIATYSGYGGYSNPCITSVPLPSSCIASAVSTTDSDWTFSTYTTNTTQPTSLPLAPGTWSNCSTYTQYIAPARNSSTINSCYVVATMYDASSGVSTPTPTQTGMAEDCTSFYHVQSGDGCYNIAANNGIALDELYTWNPALNGDCSGLWPNYYICVGVGTTTTSTTTTTTTTTTTKTTTTTGAVETPTPTQEGMLSGCKSFYYVQNGDGCYDIAADNEVTLDNLYSWDPALNWDCSGLWPDYYICVRV